MTSFSQNYQ